MPIRMMCNADDAGAVYDGYWSRQPSIGYCFGHRFDMKAMSPVERECRIGIAIAARFGAIYLRESHAGLVLSTGEHNMRDDSDFYAIVWNPERGEPERIEYASTRGWTYPNSATVDATPEVKAAFAAYEAKQVAAARERRNQSERMTPTKTKRVRFVRGTTTKNGVNGERVKITAGATGTVFWYGEERLYGPRNGYKAHGRDMRRMVDSMLPPHEGVRAGYRVGVALDTGERVFTTATNVLVILDEAEASEAA